MRGEFFVVISGFWIGNYQFGIQNPCYLGAIIFKGELIPKGTIIFKGELIQGSVGSRAGVGREVGMRLAAFCGVPLDGPLNSRSVGAAESPAVPAALQRGAPQ